MTYKPPSPEVLERMLWYFDKCGMRAMPALARFKAEQDIKELHAAIRRKKYARGAAAEKRAVSQKHGIRPSWVQPSDTWERKSPSVPD